MDIVTVIMLETMMRSLIRIVMTKTTTEIMLMTTTMMVMMMLMMTIVKLHMSWGCVLGGAPGWESVGGLSAGFWRSDTRTIPGYSSPTLRLSNSPRLLFLERESSSDSDPRQTEAAHIRHSGTRAVWVFLECSKVPRLFKVTVKLEKS